MTKAELLADLASKPFVNGLVGDPILIETKSNGDKRYQQNVREVSSTGTHAMYVNIDFFVINEIPPVQNPPPDPVDPPVDPSPSPPPEMAFYKDADPVPSVQWTAFQDWVGNELYTKKMLPPGDGTFIDFEIIKVDETYLAGAFRGWIVDPTDPNKIIPQGFYVRKDLDGSMFIRQMDLDANVVAAQG